MINIGYQIKELRKASGMTQTQLAIKLKTTQSVVSRLESRSYKGHTVRVLEMIAKIFKVKLQVGFL